MGKLDYGAYRGLEKRQKFHLSSCQRIRCPQNVIITGLTGVGKQYVACALAHKACLEIHKTRYYRLSRLVEALQTTREVGTCLNAFRQHVRLDVLVLDDWGRLRIDHRRQRDLMELLDDRYNVGYIILTSQYPLGKWHEIMEDSH